jgi:hypothetical protein
MGSKILFSGRLYEDRTVIFSSFVKSVVDWLNVFYTSCVVVSQVFKHFTKVEKITIRWIALSDLRTTGPRPVFNNTVTGWAFLAV